MIVNEEKYILVSKNFPMEFIDQDWDITENVIEARKFDSEVSADCSLQDLDEPDRFQVLKVEIGYRF